MASGTTLGTGYVQIEPSAKGIKGKMEQALNPQMTGAGKTSGATLGASIASSMTKYISAAAIGTAITKSLTEGAALEQSIGGIETLFKSSADTVIANANNAWKTAGVSANSYMEQATRTSAALLQSLGGDTDKAASYVDMAITDMADNANKMGTPIENIQNAYAGLARNNFTMLDNLSLGYAGSQEGMKKLLADAEKLSGQKYSIDSLSDMYDAIHVIQTNLGITGTTAKEAATTLSGSFGSMKAAAQDFMGNISMRPELVQQSMSNLIESIKTFGTNLIPALGNILKSIGGLASEYLSGDFLTQIMNGLGSLSGKLLSGATTLIDTGLGLLMKLAEGIAKGLPAFIQQAPIIVSNIADIINNNAPKIIPVGLHIIKTLAIGLVKAIPTLIRSIPAILRAIMKAFMAFNWVNLGRSVIVGMRTSLTGPVEQGLKGVITKIKTKAGSIVENFKSPFIRARDAIKGIVDRIKGFFNFSTGIPKVKIPKFSITPAGWKVGDLLKGTIPRLGITWHAEGGIMTSPTIFGVGGSNLLAGGEAGAEGIIPLDPFWNRLDNTLQAMQATGGQLNLVITLDGETLAKSTVDYVNGQTLRYGTSPLMV